MKESNLILLIICSVLFAGALIGLFYRMKSGFGPFNLKVYGLTIVIGFTVLVSLSGAEAETLTPCYAILSAFAGYLFGIQNKET